MRELYFRLAEWFGEDPFQLLLEYAGTFAGAISGVRMASVKKFDWFGAYVVGFVTALGGGTLRDMMLNISPFWMKCPSYLITCMLAVISISVFGRRFISEKITWFVFDTVAIALFTVFGIEKALYYSFPWWCAIAMGTITAVFGGVIRDVLINEVPLIFRKEIYAMACVAGGMLYMILHWCGVSSRISATLCIVLIFAIRALAIKYSWSFPVLKGHRIYAKWEYDHRHARNPHNYVSIIHPTADKKNTGAAAASTNSVASEKISAKNPQQGEKK